MRAVRFRILCTSSLIDWVPLASASKTYCSTQAPLCPSWYQIQNKLSVGILNICIMPAPSSGLWKKECNLRSDSIIDNLYILTVLFTLLLLTMKIIMMTKWWASSWAMTMKTTTMTIMTKGEESSLRAKDLLSQFISNNNSDNNSKNNNKKKWS